MSESMGSSTTGSPRRWVRVGSSTLPDSQAALAGALQGIAGTTPPKLVVLLASPHYDLAAVAAGLRDVLPDGTAVIGCTTSGEIADAGSLRQSLVLWALGGEGISVATGMGQGDGQGLRQAATQAAYCLERLPLREHTVLLLLADGLCGDQMDVVRGAYDVASLDVPLVGGCAGDDLAMKRTNQILGDRVLTQAVVAAAISSEAPLGIGVSHGWKTASPPMLVTGSKGNVLASLDDRPALDVYLEFFDPPEPVRHDATAFAAFAACHPIGVRRRDKIEMRHVSGADFLNRQLLTVAEVPEGGLAFLTEGDVDSVLEAAEESLKLAIGTLEGAPPVGLLLFDCVSRRSIFDASNLHEETDLIAATSGGVPMAGFYTYGEIARTKGAGGFHNQTLVTLAIS